MAPRDSNILEELHESLAVIFDQAQLSLANHRKNCVALYKLHHQAANVTRLLKNGTVVKLTGERVFGDVFINLVNRVLVVKKGPPTADRIVKFVGLYVKFVNEKVSAEREKTNTSPSSSASARTSDDDDNLASRFVSRLLRWLFQGFVAKNKIIRYRSVCIVSEMISHLGEIDEDTYSILRDSLMERICDKESLIRSHATIALSKLIGSEDPNELEPGEKTILEVLLDIVCFDPLAEVRRAALLHIPLNQITLDTILSRTRDVDPVNRKLVYSGVLQTKLGDPRQLTIAQREQIVKDGLGDREPGVRVAAGKMVAIWFDMVMAEPDDADQETWEGDDGGIMKGFIKFLSLFDVFGPGEAVAVDAMLSIFVTRPDISNGFIFPDEFWKVLTPESAVLARVFVEDCIATQKQVQLESASLPVVTAFAFHLQEAYNALVDILQDAENTKLLNGGEYEDEEEAERREEELAKREMILGELLRMALGLDYMDEIGRRKVFSVVRDMLAHPELPLGLIAPCLDVLREIMPSERELIRVMVEIIIELREDEEPEIHDGQSIANFDDSQSDIAQPISAKDKSLQRKRQRKEMTPEECADADIIDLRCLVLCIGMLERVHGSFEDNSTLEGILADLIIPSVKRKELVMREKGLISLGLCCLIAKNMALSSMQLFLGQVQSAPEELKLRVLQVIFDLLLLYDHDFFRRSDNVAKQIVDFLLQTLEVEDSAPVQAVLCIGLSKLVLSGMIMDPRVLTCLVLTYVSPTTASNQELRQCLSYFLPVYSYSSPTNQGRMQSIFIPAFDLVTRIYEDKEEDQKMITPYQFGLLMIDWTNPQKVSDMAKAGTHSDIHVELGIDIVAALYDSERPLEVQKVLCQLLNQLYIVPGSGHRPLLKLNVLLSHHEEQCPFNDASLDRIFSRFKSRFNKIFGKDLQQIDARQYIDDEFHDLYSFIGIDMPEGGPQSEADAIISSSREQSNIPEQQEEPPSSTDEDIPSSPTPSPQKAKAKRTNTAAAKRRTRQPTVTPDKSSEDDEISDNATPVQPMITPKRKGIKRVHTPGSGRALTSPSIRKRSRMKSPRQSRLQQPLTMKGAGASMRSGRRVGPSKRTLAPEGPEEVSGDEDSDSEAGQTTDNLSD